LREQYIRTGEGFIIAYSITSKRTFEDAKKYREQILQVKKEDFYPIVLVGNKVDLAIADRAVPREGTLDSSF
jgi:GTPase KRas